MPTISTSLAITMITPRTIPAFLLVSAATILASLIPSTTAEPTLIPVDYSDGSTDLQGFLALPKKLPAPAVVVILPDWDGVNGYEKSRAAMVASELGYAAFAADIYGADLHEVKEFNSKVELSTLYRNDTTLFLSRIQAAVDLMKGDFAGVHQENIGVIGYCLGGTGVLLYALSGADDAVALVSLHGGLLDFEVGPTVDSKLLVLSGGEDDTATDIQDLELKLSSTGAIWEITRYSGIQHGFTVWDTSAYDAWADARSWRSMRNFLAEAFGIDGFDGGEPDASDTKAIDYVDTDGTKLRGYLSLPITLPRKDSISGKRSHIRAVVIFPDWDGVNEYEKLRATMLSDAGYIAFAADVYGVNLQENLTLEQKMELSSSYRNDATLYTQRMKAAIDAVISSVRVDLDGQIAIIGYCFGGTGVVHYAFSGATDVEIAVAFHGGLTNLPTPRPEIHARVVVLSGGMDDAHGNQVELEEALNRDEGSGAGWEITRYGGVEHGFTAWGQPGYNLLADARSWEAMMTVFDATIDEQVLMAPGTNSSNKAQSLFSFAFSFILTFGLISL